MIPHPDPSPFFKNRFQKAVDSLKYTKKQPLITEWHYVDDEDLSRLPSEKGPLLVAIMGVFDRDENDKKYISYVVREAFFRPQQGWVIENMPLHIDRHVQWPPYVVAWAMKPDFNRD